MQSQNFARNILAAAVLSAMGAHVAVADDYSAESYENRGNQDEYDIFSVKNTNASELQNQAGVFIRDLNSTSGSLTVKKQFNVDISSTQTTTPKLAGVRLDSNSSLTLQDDAVISVKNTLQLSGADVQAGAETTGTYGLFSNGANIKAGNLDIGVEAYNSAITSGIFAVDSTLSAENLTIKVNAATEAGDADLMDNTTVGGGIKGAYGLYAMGSTVTSDSLNIAVTNTEKATGIVLDNEATMTLNGLSINVKSDKYVAVGIDSYSESQSSDSNNLVVNGNTDIKSEGIMARGLAVEYTKATFNSKTSIEASGEQSAYGVWASTGTLVDFKDHVVIKTTATGGEGYAGESRAIFVKNSVPDTEATVRFFEGAEIFSDGYALYGDGDTAQIYLYSSDNTVTNIVGDVYVTNGAMVDIDLSEGGTFTGATSGDGMIYIALDKGALWNVTKESSLFSLTLKDSRLGDLAHLSFASADATLKVNELSMGNGTTVVKMNELPASGKSYINAESIGECDDSAKINAVMSGNFNDVRTSSTSAAVNDAANAIFGKDNELTTNVTNVYFEEGRLEGAVEATRNDDGSFTVIQRANEKIESVKTIAVLSALQWRHDMNDLTKRMGELRTSPEGIGGWARAYGSKLSHGGIDMKNSSVQLGADADVGMGWKAGAAFTYTDGSSKMTNGSADNQAYGLAAYGMWLGEDGHFIDLIAKVSRLETDYGVKGTSGSFENNAFSISAEYGRHFKLADVAFIEPQLEVTWGHIIGDDFLNSEGVRIELDDFDSLIGRMGVRAGFNFLNDKGLVYARASVLHDFKGESEAVASLGAKSIRMSDDIGGTWGEFGIGANFYLTPATYTYVDLEKTTGGEVSEKWRWNVGMRHVF